MPRGAKKDIAISRLLVKNGLLLDKRSFVSLGPEPHLFLRGYDIVYQRQRVWSHSKDKCASCKRLLSEVEWEMDHIQGGMVGRHDDLSNLRALCRDCHRKRHVQVQWGKRVAELPAETVESE
jgi:hypothetical protein